LVVDDRGWSPGDDGIPVNFFEFVLDGGAVGCRNGGVALSYSGLSALTLRGASTTGQVQTSYSTVRATAAGVATELDLSAASNPQYVTVQSTSADQASRLTLIGGRDSSTAVVNGSSSPVVYRSTQGSASNLVAVFLRNATAGTSVAFLGAGGRDVLSIDADDRSITAADFHADASGAVVLSPAAFPGATVTASNIGAVRVINLPASVPAPTAVTSTTLVSTGRPLNDVVVGAFTSSLTRSQVQILWGDGATGAGDVVPDPSAPDHYFVRASHTFARAGSYTPGLIVTVYGSPQDLMVAGVPIQLVTFGSNQSVSTNSLAVYLEPSGLFLDEGVYGTTAARPSFRGVVNSNYVRLVFYATPQHGGAPILIGQGLTNGPNWLVGADASLADGAYTITVQAFDDVAHLASALTPAFGTLIIDTVGPRIAGVQFFPRRGEVVVTYRDDGVGLDFDSVRNTGAYGFSALTSSPPGRGAPTTWTVTGAVGAPAWRNFPQRITLKINNGAPIPRGSYRFSARSLPDFSSLPPYYPLHLPPSLLGVQDRLGNPLQGGFNGRFPTSGPGDFAARLTALHGRGLRPTPLAATALAARRAAAVS
jgi:hypothetical protein